MWRCGYLGSLALWVPSQDTGGGPGHPCPSGRSEPRLWLEFNDSTSSRSFLRSSLTGIFLFPSSSGPDTSGVYNRCLQVRRDLGTYDTRERRSVTCESTPPKPSLRGSRQVRLRRRLQVVNLTSCLKLEFKLNSKN